MRQAKTLQLDLPLMGAARKPDETSYVARKIDEAVEAWRAKKSVGSSQ
jgi:hypothetical protein